MKRVEADASFFHVDVVVGDRAKARCRSTSNLAPATPLTLRCPALRNPIREAHRPSFEEKNGIVCHPLEKRHTCLLEFKAALDPPHCPRGTRGIEIHPVCICLACSDF
jgi:hypothetical protein